jgi:hypothetical protein
VFGVAPADLMDGISDNWRNLFWLAFNAFIVAMLFVDLLLVSGKNHVVKLRDAMGWSFFWILLSFAFAGLVFYFRGRGPAMLWITAYLLEKFLSVDNLFVFLTIFMAFKTPAQYQHKVSCVVCCLYELDSSVQTACPYSSRRRKKQTLYSS